MLEQNPGCRGMRAYRIGWTILIAAIAGLTSCLEGPKAYVEPPPPVDTVIVPATAYVTVGRSTVFNARVNGTPATEVAWSVLEPGGGSVDSQGVYRAPAAPGVYTVQAAFQVGAGQTATARVNVVAPPAGVISAPPRVQPGAEDQKASIVPLPGSRYQWSVTGGAITAGTDAAAVTFAAGSGPKVTLACTVTNAAGDRLTSSLEVPVVAPVTLAISPATATVTVERAMKFGFSIQGGTSLAVTWSQLEPGAGSLDQQGNYVAPPVPGLYSVRVTAKDDPTVTATAQVKVVARPPESIVAPGSFQPGAQGLRAMVPEVDGMTYAWTVEGGSITSGADAATVVFAAGDGPELTVRCTITNEAGDAFSVKRVLKLP